MQDISDTSRKSDRRKQDIFHGLYIDKCYLSVYSPFFCRIIKLLEIFRIEAFELRDHEKAVFSDQYIVEIDLAASVFWSLDHDEIPVYGGFVAVESVFVCGSRRQVEAARDLFVKESIFHRLQHIRIHTRNTLRLHRCRAAG